MCFGPSVNPAAGAPYGGASGMLSPSQPQSQAYQPSWLGGPFGFGGQFGASPWMSFLMNYLSGYGAPAQPMSSTGAGASIGAALPPASAAPAAPAPVPQASTPAGPALYQAPPAQPATPPFAPSSPDVFGSPTSPAPTLPAIGVLPPPSPNPPGAVMSARDPSAAPVAPAMHTGSSTGLTSLGGIGGNPWSGIVGR